MNLDRITTNPHLMGGRPCIRGMRFPVSRIRGMLAAGEKEQTVLDNHPELGSEELHQTLAYAAMVTDYQIVPLGLE